MDTIYTYIVNVKFVEGNRSLLMSLHRRINSLFCFALTADLNRRLTAGHDSGIHSGFLYHPQLRRCARLNDEVGQVADGHRPNLRSRDAASRLREVDSASACSAVHHLPWVYTPQPDCISFRPHEDSYSLCCMVFFETGERDSSSICSSDHSVFVATIYQKSVRVARFSSVLSWIRQFKPSEPLAGHATPHGRYESAYRYGIFRRNCHGDCRNGRHRYL